jgi:hypothetical protein
MLSRALVLTAALASAPIAANLVDLRATPTLAGARLRIAVKQPGGTANVRRFAILHEHPMHLFVVGEGLDFFAHEFPAPQPDGVFMADVTLPRTGPYMGVVEFQPEGGAPQIVHQAFTTGSAFGRTARPAIDTEPKTVDGVRVSLDASAVKAGERQPMTIQFDDAPASAHVFAMSSDLTESIHEYPAAEGLGPAIEFRPLFPRAGIYKLWVLFERGGRQSTAAFVIDVR